MSLHGACCDGDLDLIKELVTNKANINKKNSYGETPLHIACKSKKSIDNIIGIVRYLISLENIIVDEQNNLGFTPLHTACYYDNLEIAILLIETSKSLVNKTDNHGNIPLHLACCNISERSIKLVKCLIENGSNINEKNIYGYTPLHLASCDNKLKIVYMLIEYGADTTIKNHKGQTFIDCILSIHIPDVKNFIEGCEASKDIKCPDE